MTDFAAYTDMLDRAGIAWERASADPGYDLPPHLQRRAAHIVDVRASDADASPNVGWGGFYASAYFDADGALIAIGAWE
jgi:hypothetical protein